MLINIDTEEFCHVYLSQWLILKLEEQGFVKFLLSPI